MYNATRGLSYRVHFEHDLRELHCSSSALGIIDCLAAYPSVEGGYWACSGYKLVNSPSTEPKYRYDAKEALSTVAADIMLTIMRCLVLDREDHYLAEHTPTLRFLSEFRTLLSAATGSLEEYAEFHTWYTANQSLRLRGMTLETLVIEFLNAWHTPTNLPEVSRRRSFFSRFHDTTIKMRRRLAQLDNGHLAAAPSGARSGDLVCVLFGCSVPVVLRPCNDGQKYSFVGECYVDQCMNGEAAHSWKSRMFCII